MKYQKEVNDLLKELFYESWFDENDWNEYLNELLLATNNSLEGLSNDIQTGIDNGYTLEFQLNLLRNILKYEK